MVVLCLRRGFAVLADKSFHSSLGVDEFLFTGKERMTIGADLCCDPFLGGTGLKLVSARTSYCTFHIPGMNTFLHLQRSFVARAASFSVAGGSFSTLLHLGIAYYTIKVLPEQQGGSDSSYRSVLLMASRNSRLL